MPDITPFLWFDGQAHEAAKFYVSVFPNSKITQVVRRTEAVPVDAGEVLTVAFELDGKPVTALNGGPHFKLSEAFSFVVHCKDQAEIDYYWNALNAEGEGQCGWLKDKFGLSWQIVPEALPELLSGGNANAVMAAIMPMKNSTSQRSKPQHADNGGLHAHRHLSQFQRTMRRCVPVLCKDHGRRDYGVDALGRHARRQQDARHGEEGHACAS